MGPNGIQIFVVHQNAAAATGIRYQVVKSSTFRAMYLADNPQFPVVEGDSETGMTICYGACLASPVLANAILYVGTGLSGVCSWIALGAHPDAATAMPEVSDCDGGIFGVTSAGSVIINPTVACECGTAQPSTYRAASHPPFPLCETVASESSTWGRIKALFQ